MRPRRFILLALSTCVASCAIGSVPIPDERAPSESGDSANPGSREQWIDREAVYYSSTPIYIVGVEGAVAGVGELVAENPARQGATSRAVPALFGSFVMPINAGVGDAITLSFVVQGEVVDSMTLTIESPPNELVNAAAALDDYEAAHPGGSPQSYGGLTVSSPDAEGMVTVSSPPTWAPQSPIIPGTTIIVSNLTQGFATSAVVAEDRSFSAKVRAASSDELRGFAVLSNAPNGGPAFALIVP